MSLFINFFSLLCLILSIEAAKHVEYTGRAVVIDGKPTLLVCGAIHYPRSTTSQYKPILSNAKQGGLNCIETYVFWNHAQPNANSPPDFRELLQFLKVAKSLDLYVMLRIGPYVCAEWDFGGFPRWLLASPTIRLRTYEEQYLALMKQFLKQTLDAVKDYLAVPETNGPIVLLQVENEYGWLQPHYGSDGKRYASWCASTAHELEPRIPWIMCQQDDQPTVINTCNGFYCDQWIRDHVKRFPDQPPLFTELWTGWFQAWGDPKPTRPVEDLAFSVARWFQLGGAGINYYMYHGGTNFDKWAGGPLMTTSYDYDAPLNQHGAPNEPKYSHLRQLNQLLLQNQDILLQDEIPTTFKSNSHVEINHYGNESTGMIAFLSNIDLHETSIKFSLDQQDYTLPGWSTTILIKSRGNNQWYRAYCTAEVHHHLFLDQTLPKTLERRESFEPRVVGQLLEAVPVFEPKDDRRRVKINHPVEQIRGTIGADTDYLWHSTSFESFAENIQIKIKEFYEYAHVFVDGEYCCSEKGGNIQSTSWLPSKVSPNELDCSCPLSSSSPHNLTILTMIIGLDNIRGDMEKLTKGILGKVLLDNRDVTRAQWLVVVGMQGELEDWSISKHWKTWKPVNGISWTCLEFDLKWDHSTDDREPYYLDLSSMNKGMAYVNGHNIGRYWNIVANHGLGGKGECREGCTWQGAFHSGKCLTGCKKPSQSLYFVPREFLFEEKIKIVLMEELSQDVDPGKVRLVKFSQ